MSITTILQVYKRPAYLNEQINAIKAQSRPSDKIIIVRNEGGVDFTYPEGVEVIKSNRNKKYHFRFAIGLLEDSEYLAFFDDDTIPGENWYKNCLETIERHDCICVGNARNVLQDCNQNCPAGWCNPNNMEVQCWFGGHSWFLKKKNLKYMWYDDIIEYNNGEDIMLSANNWIYNNLPTYTPPHPINDRSLWSSLDGKKLGSDSVASWITRPTHYAERQKLLQYYLNKSWKPF